MQITVNESILFWAFRYALGRMTYATGDVGDHIIMNQEKLSHKFKKNVIHEIREREYKNELGMECDRKNWINVKSVLIESIKNENSQKRS